MLGQEMSKGKKWTLLVVLLHEDCCEDTLGSKGLVYWMETGALLTHILQQQILIQTMT